MGRSARLQGGPRAQKLSQRTRCPAASLNPPCLLKWGLLKTLSGAVRWRSTACRPQGRRCSPNVAGLIGSSHIWFPFKRPNVIKFSPTQRKSLVRCGFPPSTRVKKSLSRTPVADRRSSRPPIPPAPPRKGLCSALFSRAEGARALPARRNSRGQSSCGLRRGGEVSHPGKTAAGPRLTLGTHQCLDARGLVTPCRGIPLSVAPHSRMCVHLWPASVGNTASPVRPRVGGQLPTRHAWRRVEDGQGQPGSPPEGSPGAATSQGLAGCLWPVRAPNGLRGSWFQGAGPWWDGGRPLPQRGGPLTRVVGASPGLLSGP